MREVVSSTSFARRSCLVGFGAYACGMSESLSATPDAVPWIANDATFAARLALIRQRMGWNAKEAALACGIPQQSWRSWEAGTVPHGSRYFGICAQIARATGCDYGWLVDRRPTGTVETTLPKFRREFRSLPGEGRKPRPAWTQSPLLAVASE